jgi:hypothetical protein
MEASACFAVAEYRGIQLAALFYAGDSVAQPKWQPRRTKRGLVRTKEAQEKLLKIAIDALLWKRSSHGTM